MSYKVSIIIPVYNSSKYIVDKTLKSIENQTMDYEDIEVILINDCSSDNTEEVINKYAEEHANIVPIHLRENAGGPAIPRNIGITYASADYLMFLDQDDTFKKDACQVLYDKITEENVEMVCGNHNLVLNGKSNKCFEFEWAQEDEIKIKNIYENPNFLTMGVAAWNKIFSKKLILDNNIMFTEGVGEDIFFSIRALLLADGIILLKDFIVVDYNIRQESLSHQVDCEYLIEFSDFYLKFLDYCENNIEDVAYQPLFTGRMNQLLSALFYANLYYDELARVLLKIQEIFIRLNNKNFMFENNFYEVFYRVLLNDEYPFDSTVLYYASIKANRENTYDHGIKFLEQEAKCYIDCGRGFNEKDKVSAKYRISKENCLTFDISDFNNIKQIRFDPITWFFIKCKIIEITSNLDENIDYKVFNALNTKNNVDTFLTTDSQYRLYGDFDKIDSIQIKFSVSIIRNNEIEKIFNNK